MANKLLIFTATLNTGECSGLVIKNQEQRKLSYVATLAKYLAYGDYRIVAVENSGSDLSFLLNVFPSNNRLELISFDGNHGTGVKGKGLGEYASLKYALTYSAFAQEASFFFKTAGRYFSRQIPQVIESFDPNAYQAVFEKIPTSNVAPTVFFGADKAKFLESSLEVNDSAGLIFERAIWPLVAQLKVLWLDPMKYDPTIVGGSGQLFTGF